MGIALGLIAALGWGLADFLARYATHRVGSYRTLLYMQFVGLAGVTAFVVLSGQLTNHWHDTSWQPWAWTVAAALTGTFGALSLYRAFETGVLSIVSPIAASSAAVTVVLALIGGEALSAHRFIGIAVALIGVVVASYAPSQVDTATVTGRYGLHRIPPGVGWALVASIGLGVSIWAIGARAAPALGSIIPVWLTRAITPVVLCLVARPLRQGIAMPRGTVWWLLSAVGVLDTAAFLAGTAGLRSDQVSVVSVIISLFSAVTVLLAWIFLREHLHRHQWVGIGVILVGVAVVSA